MPSEKPSRFFYVCLLTTLFLAIFYNTVTNMAGIYIVSELGGDNYISIYAMVFFGLGNILSLPLANPLADRFGPIKLQVYSLLIYTFFSILCGLAPTFFIFNLYRLGMGIAVPQPHFTARGWAQIAGADGDGGEGMQRRAELVERSRHNVELDVGAFP